MNSVSIPSQFNLPGIQEIRGKYFSLCAYKCRGKVLKIHHLGEEFSRPEQHTVKSKSLEMLKYLISPMKMRSL